MDTARQLLDLNPRQVFIKVLLDSIKNIIFFGFLALVIALIMNGLGWKTFGLVLGIIYAIVVAISLIKFLFIDLLLQLAGIVVALKELFSGQSSFLGQQLYLLCGTIVLLAENAISILYVLYLYRAYY